MPLLPNVLLQEILKLTDKTRPDFVGYPLVLTPEGALDVAGTNLKVAQNWANAAYNFFRTISVPPAPPPAVVAGRGAFQTAMFALLGPPGSPTAAAALAQGFAAMALAIATASPPVAIPPPAPLVIPVGPPIADPVPPALNIANAVFLWTKTGLYGPPPAPPSIPWS